MKLKLDESQNNIIIKNKEMEELKDKDDFLLSQIDIKNKEIDDLKIENDNISNQIEDKKKEIEEMNDKNNLMEKQIEDMNKEKLELKPLYKIKKIFTLNNNETQPMTTAEYLAKKGKH